MLSYVGCLNRVRGVENRREENGGDAHSGKPSGGRAMLRTSLMSLCLRTRSLAVVDVSDGDAFTSMSHGFSVSSIRPVRR